MRSFPWEHVLSYLAAPALSNVQMQIKETLDASAYFGTSSPESPSHASTSSRSSSSLQSDLSAQASGLS